MLERMNGTSARKLAALGASLAVLGGGLLVSEGASARGKASTKVTIQGGGSVSGEVWCYCFADEAGLLIPKVSGETTIPPSPLGG